MIGALKLLMIWNCLIDWVFVTYLVIVSVMRSSVCAIFPAGRIQRWWETCGGVVCRQVYEVKCGELQQRMSWMWLQVAIALHCLLLILPISFPKMGVLGTHFCIFGWTFSDKRKIFQQFFDNPLPVVTLRAWSGKHKCYGNCHSVVAD